MATHLYVNIFIVCTRKRSICAINISFEMKTRSWKPAKTTATSTDYSHSGLFPQNNQINVLSTRARRCTRTDVCTKKCDSDLHYQSIGLNMQIELNVRKRKWTNRPPNDTGKEWASAKQGNVWKLICIKWSRVNKCKKPNQHTNSDHNSNASPFPFYGIYR